MYKKILAALDHSPADDALLPELAGLAKRLEAEVVLVHVADGWAARNFERLKLAESEEMRNDRAYLERRREELAQQGLRVSVHLALGDPPHEILRSVDDLGCDLIAMTSHGHRLVGDIFLGQTIETVRHRAQVPLFIVNARRQAPAG